MMYWTVALVISVGVIVLAYDRDKLAMYPPCMKKYDINMDTGLWYYQASIVPCSWSGYKSFTDPTQSVRVTPGQDYITVTESWRGIETVACSYDAIKRENMIRSGESCVSVDSRIVPKAGKPSVRVYKDPIGDVISGDEIVVATDGGKSFAIYWGCTKKEVSGKCADPLVDVVTRRKHPSPGTMRTVESILRYMWNLSIDEMTIFKQENECRPDIPSKGRTATY